jgi:hypothetical protein
MNPRFIPTFIIGFGFDWFYFNFLLAACGDAIESSKSIELRGWQSKGIFIISKTTTHTSAAEIARKQSANSLIQRACRETRGWWCIILCDAVQLIGR